MAGLVFLWKWGRESRSCQIGRWSPTFRGMKGQLCNQSLQERAHVAIFPISINLENECLTLEDCVLLFSTRTVGVRRPMQETESSSGRGARGKSRAKIVVLLRELEERSKVFEMG
jgi:hypothetical protein